MALLEVRDITKMFGGLTAVKDVSFDVENREIVSLIGPNGAGKTTVFSIISGFVMPTLGTVTYDNKKITGLEAYKIANLGIVATFQKTKVFPTLTVEEAVMLGTHNKHMTSPLDILFRTKKFYSELEISKIKVAKILEHTRLINKKNFMCTELSYGEQRVLEIAVAMAAEPKILLLDEPAVGLNHTESKYLMNMIYDIRNSGVTILLIEHDMNFVMKISDRVVVLNCGKKICFGTPQEVANNEMVIKAYLGSDVEDVN